MSNKNWKWYIDNDDLMGCYERFQNAPANWKNHWWSTIEEIFHSSEKWVKEYVLDPIQRTIVKLVKKIKSVASALGSYTYFIKIFDENGKQIEDGTSNIPELKPNQSTIITITSYKDCINATRVKVEKLPPFEISEEKK